MNNTYLDNFAKKDCNGCGACYLVCPVNAIAMIEDERGFLYPQINKQKCINCNKCRRLCGNFNDKKIDNEKVYATINNSEEELEFSSSGGMFFILAKYVMNKNGVVCGVTYNKDLEVVHEFADTLEGCKKFCGSKYVRSNLQDSYIKAENYLKADRFVLFTGTACQLSGLKAFLGKDYDKLILCDVLCHANPSPKVFKLYIKNLEMIKGKKIKNIAFRDKKTGWKNQTPIIEYSDGSKEEEASYFYAFVNELINRESCYNCQFATKRRITDFTIGDLWGVENIMPEIDTKKGVSLMSVNSEKGFKIFDEIKSDMSFSEVDYDIAASYNHYSNINPNKNSEQFFKQLEDNKINENNIIKYMKKYIKKPLYVRITNKARRVLKKIF